MVETKTKQNNNNNGGERGNTLHELFYIIFNFIYKICFYSDTVSLSLSLAFQYTLMTERYDIKYEIKTSYTLSVCFYFSIATTANEQLSAVERANMQGK